MNYRSECLEQILQVLNARKVLSLSKARLVLVLIAILHLYENIKSETSSECVDEENPKTSKKEKAKKTKMSSEEKKSQKMKHEKDRKTSKSKKKIKKKPEAFDELDVKIDMSNESLKPQKIKLASNLLVECRTIVVDEPGVKKFSYPGIVFIRKMKDGNCFEFNLPMAITSRIITAL
jgi:hypothetical protein